MNKIKLDVVAVEIIKSFAIEELTRVCNAQVLGKELSEGDSITFNIPVIVHEKDLVRPDNY